REGSGSREELAFRSRCERWQARLGLHQRGSGLPPVLRKYLGHWMEKPLVGTKGFRFSHWPGCLVTEVGMSSCVLKRGGLPVAWRGRISFNDHSILSISSSVSLSAASYGTIATTCFAMVWITRSCGDPIAAIKNKCL